jgi:hypothetical protein
LLEDPGQAIQHVFIANAQNADALGMQKLVALRVFHFLRIVDWPIHLYCDPVRCGEEVHDASAHRVLPAEFDALDRPAANGVQQDHLGLRGRLSHLTCPGLEHFPLTWAGPVALGHLSDSDSAP